MIGYKEVMWNGVVAGRMSEITGEMYHLYGKWNPIPSEALDSLMSSYEISISEDEYLEVEVNSSGARFVATLGSITGEWAELTVILGRNSG